MEAEYNNQELQEMQKCQMEILKELKKVCVRNRINFYLAFGSALGSVRHKGFIPWDDDIDVYMRVEDVNKLLSLQSEFPSNLFIQTRETDPEYGLLIARVRHSNTTLIEADHIERDINHGVYIDIYPLFYCPESDLKMKFVVLVSFLCRLFAYDAPPMNKNRLLTGLSKVLLCIFPPQLKKMITNKFYNYLISQPASKYVSNIPDVSRGKRFLDRWFLTPSVGDFEGEIMPLPTNSEEYLTYEFGDYMQLPPVEQRVIHHNYIFADFSTPYLKYKGIKYLVK